jgi:hypothetical protein
MTVHFFHVLLWIVAINTFRIVCFYFFYFSQIYNLLYNGAISKYVMRKHLCGAIIQ